MPSGLMCIECRFVRENQGILARLRVETRMRQGIEIIGGKSSSFEYSSINHTSSEYKKTSHGDQKVVEQVTTKELLYLKFGR